MITSRKLDAERALFISDWHIPFHDADTVDLILEFAAWFQPHKFFVVGDFIDCYAISRFDKDPQRLLSLQEEVDTGQSLLRCIRRACPQADIVYLEGNHEARLQRYLWQHPEISTLDCLQLPELLGFGDIGAQYHTYQQSVLWHGLRVEHGHIARKHSAATAKGMLESRGVSGISGHTHRMGSYFVTDERDTRAWWENGCGCRLDPDYCIGHPNWQQGFAVAHAVSRQKRFILEQIPILGHELFYNERLWSC